MNLYAIEFPTGLVAALTTAAAAGDQYAVGDLEAIRKVQAKEPLDSESAGNLTRLMEAYNRTP